MSCYDSWTKLHTFQIQLIRGDNIPHQGKVVFLWPWLVSAALSLFSLLVYLLTVLLSGDILLSSAVILGWLLLAYLFLLVHSYKQELEEAGSADPPQPLAGSQEKYMESEEVESGGRSPRGSVGSACSDR